MLQVLMFALLQAVAGDPGPAPAPAPTEQSGSAEAPAAEAPATEAPAAEEPQAAAPVAERQYRRERRCREVEVTGRRMPQRVCSNVMVPVDEPAASAPAE